MAILGHVSPEMTLRYAHLASDTIRTGSDSAIAKTRSKMRLVASAAGQFVTDRIEWLHSEMIKTRVAHGYCSRHLAAGPCSYSNICEQCDNYTPGDEFRPALDDQLADIRVLRDDANQRGWTEDVARHDNVIASLERHLRTLDRRRAPMAALDRGPEGRIIGHGYRNLENYRRRLLLGCGITWTTVPTRRIRGPTSVRRVEPLIEDHRNRARRRGDVHHGR